MNYSTFEDLMVWKRSMDLAEAIVCHFHDHPARALGDQIQRSAISIPSNIAEGAERHGNKEFARFLRYAAGSAGEMRTQLLLAERCGFLSNEKSAPLVNESREVSSMIWGLKRSLGEA